MPCMELFEKQPDIYKEIFDENSIVFSFEAGSVSPGKNISVKKATVLD